MFICPFVSERCDPIGRRDAADRVRIPHGLLRNKRPSPASLGDESQETTRKGRTMEHETMHSQTRELAQRLSGPDEIQLLWHPSSDRVELTVRDVETDVTFHVELAPATAIDAFYHPYAYLTRVHSAAQRERDGLLEREGATEVPCVLEDR
jgi:hypothetical protein